MKKSFKYSIVTSLTVPLLIYLAGAFAANSFNIGNWAIEGRVSCAILMFIGMLFGFLIPQTSIKDE